MKGRVLPLWACTKFRHKLYILPLMSNQQRGKLNLYLGGNKTQNKSGVIHGAVQDRLSHIRGNFTLITLLI